MAKIVIIEQLKNNDNLHPGLNTQIPQEIKIFKFNKFEELLKSNIDLITILAINL